jgi:hypothetical protein
MAKNKAHAYLYDEWEHQKELLKRQKARLHAAVVSQYHEYYEYDIDVFYRRRDFDIKESKKAIKALEQKISKTKKAIKYANNIYQKAKSACK